MPPPTGLQGAVTAATTPNKKQQPVETQPLLELETPPGLRVDESASQALTLQTPTPRPSPNLAARLPAVPTADSFTATPAQGGRGWALAVLALAVLFAIVGGIFVVTRGMRSSSSGGGSNGDDPGGTTAAIDAGPTPTTVDASIAGTPSDLMPDAAPVPARTVTLTIRSKPPGARIIVDGQPAGNAPVEVPVTFSTRAIAIEAESGGRVVRQAVVPDRNRTVTLTIRRATDGTDRGSLPF
jgi:hypothetical protein